MSGKQFNYGEIMQSIVTYAFGIVNRCLKSVLKYKHLVLDTYHPDNLNLQQQGREDPVVILWGQNGSAIKKFEDTLV